MRSLRRVMMSVIVATAIVGSSIAPAIADEPLGSISGDVTAPNGSWPEHWGVNLYTFDAARGEWTVLRQFDTYRGELSTTLEFVGTHYEFTGLEAGTYALCAGSLNLPDLAPQCYGDTVQPGVSEKIVLGAGDQLEDIDFDLYLGGIITGVVSNSGGGVYPWGIATAWYVDPETQEWRRAGDTSWRDSTGTYAIAGLRTGTYRVRINAALGYRTVAEYYPNAKSIDGGADIRVVAGQETTGISTILYEIESQPTTTSVKLTRSAVKEQSVAVSATATVSPTSGTIAAEGHLQFRLNGMPLGAPVRVGRLIGSSATITLPNRLPHGTYRVTAEFSDSVESHFEISQATTPLVVSGVGQKITTVLTTKLTKVRGKTTGRFTVMVTGSRSAPLGSIVLRDGSKIVQAKAVTKYNSRTSKVTFTITAMTAGKHSMRAILSEAGYSDYSVSPVRTVTIARR